MRRSELNRWLAERPAAQLRFVLPDGTLVPAHFHVTEVARVDRRFIDCGGTRRTRSACMLQVWVADDREHRLATGKLAGIVHMAQDLLGDDDLEVEVEYERGVISQYPLIGAERQEGLVLFRLGLKHTECLAPDRCGVPVAATAAAKPGCCGPGCC